MKTIKKDIFVGLLGMFMIVPTLIFTVPPVLLEFPSVSTYVAETVQQKTPGCLSISPVLALGNFFSPNEAMAKGGGGGGGSSNCCSGYSSYGQVCRNGVCTSIRTSYSCSSACYPCKTCLNSRLKPST